MATRFEQIKSNMNKKASEQKESTRRSYKEFLDHPLLFVALIASGLLSALAGVAIGLGVRMVGGAVEYKSDIGHVFFAILYFFLFPYFFEFGLANWLYKFLHREQENVIQFWTSIGMICVTFIGTAITAYSAMDVLVTAGGFFESFTEIPNNVQRWIAFSLPTMFLFNIVSGELYRQFTTEATLKRAAAIELRDARVASDMEVELAQMDAKRQIAIAAAEEYSRQANIQAPQLGKGKGGDQWRNDAASYRPSVNVNASAVSGIPELTDEERRPNS